MSLPCINKQQKEVKKTLERTKLFVKSAFLGQTVQSDRVGLINFQVGLFITKYVFKKTGWDHATCRLNR